MIFNHKLGKWDKVKNNAKSTITIKKKKKRKKRNAKKKSNSSLGMLNSEQSSEKRTFQLLSSCYCNLSPSQVFRLQNQI